MAVKIKWLVHIKCSWCYLLAHDPVNQHEDEEDEEDATKCCKVKQMIHFTTTVKYVHITKFTLISLLVCKFTGCWLILHLNDF